MNKMHEANHKKWNAAAPRWKARRETNGNCPGMHHALLRPELPLTEKGLEAITQHLGSMAGKNAIVLDL